MRMGRYLDLLGEITDGPGSTRTNRDGGHLARRNPDSPKNPENRTEKEITTDDINAIDDIDARGTEDSRNAQDPGTIYDLDDIDDLEIDDGTRRFVHDVSPQSVGKVDAVRTKAVALGWSRRSLYSARGEFPFPFGQGYGLVCFVHGSRTIGEITAETIEIREPDAGIRARRLVFRNPDTLPPWVKQVER